MKRIPALPTLLVGIAIALMIKLGLWQLQRADEKEVLLARYATAETLPEMGFPASATDDSLLFRRAGGTCLEPLETRIEGGLNAKGKSGWRNLVSCRTGTEGPGMVVDIGWSARFDQKIAWKGGQVQGVISRQPDHRSLIEKAFGTGSTPGLMLVLSVPAAGLEQSAPPTIRDVPNNHTGYAVQWFVFALIAAVIYGLALRRRRRG